MADSEIEGVDVGPHRSGRWVNGVSLAFYLLTAVVMALDVAADAAAAAPPGHLFIEVALMIAAIVGSAFFLRRLQVEKAEARRAREALARAEGESEAWREQALEWRREARDVLEGLGDAVDRQFRRWGLSPAEREVALLLLKGLSLKDVAEVRAVSERTARQQALGVYRKSNVSGRAELSAFFLEDLLAGSPTFEVGAVAAADVDSA